MTEGYQECRQCKLYKPWNLYAKDAKSPTGYRKTCKECTNLVLSLKKELKNHRDIQNQEGKACTKCKKFKKWDRYYKAKGARSGYASNCKDCHRLIARDYVILKRGPGRYGIQLNLFQRDALLAAGHHKCSHCKLTRDEQQFHYKRDLHINWAKNDRDEIQSYILCSRCNFIRYKNSSKP